MSKPHVLIAGGGIGGLCLAQGLQQAGIVYTVFEREENPFVRSQGYRVSLTPDGFEALHANLPEDLWHQVEQEATPQSDGIRFVDTQLHERFRRDIPPATSSTHRWGSIGRAPLRRILLSGLSNVIFGKRSTSFEYTSGDTRVKCNFSDGTSAEGEVLVGAEGTKSALREQVLKQSNLVDTGVSCIAGQLPYDEQTKADFDPEPLTSQAVVMDRPPQGMFLASHVLTNASSNDDNYVFWAFLTKRERFPDSLEAMRPADLKEVVQEMTASWHERLKRLVERTDSDTVQTLRYRSSSKPGFPERGRITLIGDAVHNMPPTGGQGANMALRDARTLCEKLSIGPDPILAIAEYETEMKDYAFRAVDDSMTNLHRMVERQAR